MSRRSSFSGGGGSQSPPYAARGGGRDGADVVYSRRKEEEPRRIYLEISNVGRQVAESKKRCRWRFSFGDAGEEHDVVLVHSKASSKKRILMDNELVHESQKFAAGGWSHAWTLGPHLIRVEINGPELEYDLVVDGIPYHRMKLRDASPQPTGLKQVLAESLKTLREDEERREAVVLANKAEVAEALAESKKKLKGAATAVVAANKLARKGSARRGNGSGAAEPADILSADPQALQAPGGNNGFDPFSNDSGGGGGGGGAVNFDPLAQGYRGGYDTSMQQLSGQFQGMSVQQQQPQYGDGSGGQYYDPMQQQQMMLQQQQQQQQSGYWAGDQQQANAYGNFDPSQWTTHAMTEPQQQQMVLANGGGDQQEHQRVRSLDKDLWVVASEKKLVALDDLKDERRAAERTAAPSGSYDRRSLAELAVHNPPPPPEARPTVMKPPPPAPQQPQQYALVPVNAMVPMGYGQPQMQMQMPPQQQQQAYYTTAGPPQQHQQYAMPANGPPAGNPYYATAQQGYGGGGGW